MNNVDDESAKLYILAYHTMFMLPIKEFMAFFFVYSSMNVTINVGK